MTFQTVSNGKVRIDKSGGETNLLLYISTEEHGPWIVAGFIEHHSYFYVSGWPKRIAKELIFWYRHYVPLKYPLFLVIPESGYVAELTEHTSFDDIESVSFSGSRRMTGRCGVTPS